MHSVNISLQARTEVHLMFIQGYAKVKFAKESSILWTLA